MPSAPKTSAPPRWKTVPGLSTLWSKTTTSEPASARLRSAGSTEKRLTREKSPTHGLPGPLSPACSHCT